MFKKSQGHCVYDYFVNKVAKLYQKNHLETYNVTAINYNRDVEIFPVLKRIIARIMGAEFVYKSPTDMGVNRAGFAIVNDDVVKEASSQEVIRRFFRYNC